MSYARAIEGETNDQVLDPAFHRKVKAPSVADEMKRAGTPALPVESIRRPRIASFPRPANAQAAADLRGQAGLTVALDAVTTARQRILEREKGVAVRRENAILSTAMEMIRRNRERAGLGQPVRTLSGLGQTQEDAQAIGLKIVRGEPLSEKEKLIWDSLSAETKRLFLEIYGVQDATIQTVQPLDPVAIARKVAAGQALTAQEQKVWEGLTPVSRGTYILVGQPKAATQPGIMEQIQAWLEEESLPGVKNLYVAGGITALLSVAVLKRRRRR